MLLKLFPVSAQTVHCLMRSISMYIVLLINCHLYLLHLKLTQMLYKPFWNKWQHLLLTQAGQLLPLMKAVFGFSAFQSKQEAINSCLEKKSTFVIMPTGGGKSLIYLLPILVQHGLTRMISPP